MKYMIIYLNGNGYHCGCCRRDWEEHEIMEFDSDDECKEYIERYNKKYEENRWDFDSQIKEAHQMFGEGEQIF